MAQGRAIPGDVGLLTVQCDSEPVGDTVDTLLLDRHLMLQTAVDHLINGRSRRLRQLVAPVLVHRGSVKS